VKLAIVGVTGVVGETILRVLDERAVSMTELGAFASRDRNEPLLYRGTAWPIRAASPEALRAGGYDAVFFASSDDASAELAEACAVGGAVVIDNSATFRMHEGVPLVVPEVNPGAALPEHRIFPVANCTAIVLCVGIAPIAGVAGLAAVRVATYQAVSGAGRAGLDALENEERAAAMASLPAASSSAGSSSAGSSYAGSLFAGSSSVGVASATVSEGSPFVAPIFRNVVPKIGSFDEFGDSGEEKKVAEETRKILDLPGLHVAATTVRVPVRYAHSEAVFLETQRDTSVEELAAALAGAPGVIFHATGVVTPRDVEGQDLVHVARLRAEPGSRRHFQLWIVGDQVRKGAATNGVQILELLIASGRFRTAAHAKN
jgi:aspartate-semialdehyde dehydrogenase